MSAEGVEKQIALTKMCLACSQEFQGDMSACPNDGTALIALNKQDPYLGKVLADRYHVTEIIGKGGMGVVYLARHQMMDRLVAIKMLQAELAGDDMSVKRFKQEAQAASALSHPHLITLHDFGIMGTQQPYLVMEYLEGVPLLDVLRADGPMEPKRAVKIFSEAADGLYHAHKQGILHRDLKPSNIILINHQGDPDFVKIVDFGLAKLMPWSGKESQHLTKTGEVFGSPIYMSPEQCMGKPLWPTSDVYSLGITLFEALTGKPPFRGSNSIQTASKHMTEAPPRFFDVRPDLVLPEGLEKVVMKCLHKNPDDRFQDMAAFKDALQAGLNTEAKVEMPSSLMVSTRAIQAITPSQSQAMAAMKAAEAAEQQQRRPMSDLRSKSSKPAVNPVMIAGAAVGVAAIGAAAFVFLVPSTAVTKGTVVYYDLQENPQVHLLEANRKTRILTFDSYRPDWKDDVTSTALGRVVEAKYAASMLSDKQTGKVTSLEQIGRVNPQISGATETVATFLDHYVRALYVDCDRLVTTPQVTANFKEMIQEPFVHVKKSVGAEAPAEHVLDVRPSHAFKVVGVGDGKTVILVDGGYFSAAQPRSFWRFTVNGNSILNSKIEAIDQTDESTWEKP